MGSVHAHPVLGWWGGDNVSRAWAGREKGGRICMAPRRRACSGTLASPPLGGSPVQDRRSFLARLGASVGATALGATGLSQLAAACTSAGSSANDTDSSARAGSAPRTPATGRAIGVQLYTLRNEMQRDVEGTLARVAGIGYREVEFAGYYDKSPADIKAMLARHGLTAPATHMPIEMLEANAAGAFDAAREI